MAHGWPTPPAPSGSAVVQSVGRGGRPCAAAHFGIAVLTWATVQRRRRMGDRVDAGRLRALPFACPRRAAAALGIGGEGGDDRLGAPAPPATTSSRLEPCRAHAGRPGAELVDGVVARMSELSAV